MEKYGCHGNNELKAEHLPSFYLLKYFTHATYTCICKHVVNLFRKYQEYANFFSDTNEFHYFEKRESRNIRNYIKNGCTISVKLR